MSSPCAADTSSTQAFTSYPAYPLIPHHRQERHAFFGVALASVDQDSGFFDKNEDLNGVSSNSVSPVDMKPLLLDQHSSIDNNNAGNLAIYNNRLNLLHVERLDIKRYSQSVEPLRPKEPANKRFRGSGVLSLREIPSWNIYFHDQRRQLAKFSDKNKGYQRDPFLNKRVSLSFYKNVLVKLDVDAVVAPTTELYSADTGVAKLLHDEAGRDLKEKCSQLPKCEVGSVEITDGCMLPAQFIFHVNGPDIHTVPYTYQEILHRCYENCLNLLIQHQLRTIAFPCISTGSRKGIPKSAAAEIALSTVRRFLEQHSDKVDRVVFCLHNKKDIDIYLRLMQIFFPVE